MNFSGRGVHFGLTIFDIMNRGFKKSILVDHLTNENISS